jgi:hypothetical protein
LSRGVVFVPFHWGDQQGENLAANYLTIPAIGRIAKQPEFKYCAARLTPAPDAPGPAPDLARTTRWDEPPKAVVDASPRPAPGTTSPDEPTPLPRRADPQTSGILARSSPRR